LPAGEWIEETAAELQVVIDIAGRMTVSQSPQLGQVAYERGAFVPREYRRYSEYVTRLAC
jgi:hypothetical protein